MQRLGFSGLRLLFAANGSKLRAPRLSGLLPNRYPSLAPRNAIGPSSVRAFSSGPGPLTREFVYERIAGVLSNCDHIEAEKIRPEASLTTDLGLDSLDVVDALFYIEEEFCIEMPDHEADQIKTVNDAVEYILRQPDAH